METLADNHFGLLDWAVVGATLLISLLIGVYYAIKSKNSNEELLVGGRNMRIFPVAASIMVTYVSAITVLGFPAEVYSFGSQIFMIHVMSAIAFPLSAFIFIPFFYKMKLTSINEYLEQRFNSKWVRWLAAATFILQQTTLSGVILYAPSIALEAFLGLPVYISILGIGICGTLYTSLGGLKAVVITDAFQFMMMVAGMIAIVVKGVLASGGISNAFQIAKEHGRLNFIDLTFDPFMRHNFWNFLIGSGFYALMQPACHQLQVQRYSSMPSITNARKAIIYSVPLKLIVMVMCLLTGISIFAVYAHCDPFKLGNIQKVDQIVPYFVVNELANVPGMIGLFTACIFSAVLSSISSSLNSLAAVTWEDFLFRITYFKKMSPKSQANVSRLIGLFYGCLTMGLAFGAQNLGAIYSATFAAVGATGGALFGVFLLGMFVPFANHVGANAGMLSGLTSLTVVSIVAFVQKIDLVRLPTFADQCPAGIGNFTEDYSELSNYTTTQGPSYSAFLADEDNQGLEESLLKIFKLSYLLYSVVAAAITVIVGIIVSLMALVCVKSTRRLPNRKYLHPLVQKLCKPCGKAGKPSVGALATSSIIRLDPIDFKTKGSSNGVPNGLGKGKPNGNNNGLVQGYAHKNGNGPVLTNFQPSFRKSGGGNPYPYPPGPNSTNGVTNKAYEYEASDL